MHPVLFLSVLIARKVEIMRFSILFSDEDLYRGAEELSASQDNGGGTLPPCQSIISFLFLAWFVLSGSRGGNVSIYGIQLHKA